ncbi:MAG: glycine cleavage system aminomethyltransferase GcvT [Anaerolineae bacterium]|nr:glycine cleavage system aminomethyltransferase GcvT [Anaerolineae bacterium]
MENQDYADYCFGVDLADIDPDISEIISLEEERQARKFVFIPSESIAPKAVRQALGSVFNNVYAEGYPPLRMTRDEEKMLLDFSHQLAYYRRYADRRFYKGVDYVHFVETLAQRRCAQLFANERVSADQIFVNVQPLSGAAANLAVYNAFMEAGDTLMGMDLYQGGHLTHGSEFNISGQKYQVVSYGVSKSTGRLDYDQIMELALEHRPKIIVAGYTSYPWAPDWGKFRKIADACGALLMADIAHTAGLAIAGVYPNPVGITDVTTFTTHKTICGPRGAVIMTTDEDKAALIDAAVFPGEQGGPHTNKFAAMAVAFQIAQTDCYKELQKRIVDNARYLAEGLQKQGIKLAYGGTDTHLLMIDLNGIEAKNPSSGSGRGGLPLRGEPAVRILDLCGLVANKNTIPGDEETALGMGIRLGTPWISQRGMGKAEMEKLAELIARILKNIQPYSYMGLSGELPRGKIDMDILEEVRCEVAALAAETNAETASCGSGYPHYCFPCEEPRDEPGVLAISGWRALPFLQEVGTNNMADLKPGQSRRTLLLDKDGQLMDDVHVLRLEPDQWNRDRYIMVTNPTQTELVKTWFRNLSDGYILFDEDDLYRKVQGPVTVDDLLMDAEVDEALKEEGRKFRDSLKDVEPLFKPGEPMPDGLSLFKAGHQELFNLAKPYFVGQKNLESVRPKAALLRHRIEKEEWHWEEPEDAPLQRTPLYEEHKKLTRKIIPFAGWEMPVWYSGVSDEHQAVRQAAGLFDVSHMGVFEIAGEYAADFLDLVCSNYVRWLDDGQSTYSYLLDPDANVIDDIWLYRRRKDLYLMVVNAANADKDWDWLNAVNEGRVLIDREHPDKEVLGKAILRNLKDPSSGERQRIDLALQGPQSLAILQSLTDDQKVKDALARVRRTDLIEVELAGPSTGSGQSFDLVIARTGYCGEEVGYEIFVHPDQAAALWNLLLEKGKPFGLQPTGLACRDSTRTEAGLPLYGHELAGPFGINPIEAGFSGYVKLHKPFFIGRRALMEKGYDTGKEVVRFRMNEKGVRVPKTGDPVVNKRGKYIGVVTSCAIDSQGYLLGLAYVDKRYNREGEQIGIFTLPGKVPPCKGMDELTAGDKVLLHDEATVLTRFPDDEEKETWRGRPGRVTTFMDLAQTE